MLNTLKKLFRRPRPRTLTEPFDTPGRRHDFRQMVINGLLGNPDDLLDRHAADVGVDIYQQMETTDPVIASAMQTRRAAVLNRGYSVIPNGAPDHIVAFVEDLVGRIDNLPAALDDCLGALTTGYAPLEIFWAHDAGRWYVDHIVGRNPADYRFDVDHTLRLITAAGDLEGRPVPPYKFVVHRHRPVRGNPYGTSVLRPLYWPVTFARTGWKFWAIAVEKYGMPIVTATFPDNATDEDRRRFARFVQDLQTESWATLPDGFAVDLHETRRASADHYLPFMQYADTKKYQVILGQHLTAEAGQTGSLAQANVHNLVRHDLTAADCRALAATINTQLIRPAVYLNFGHAGRTPLFHIPHRLTDDLEKLARTYAIAAQHVPIGQQHYREIFGIPPLADGEQPINT